MAGASGGWSAAYHDDPDGTVRVAIVDEDGVTYPVGRLLTPGQARRLVARIEAEATESRRPMKAVIRDPSFMAATVMTVKRLAI